MDGAPWDYGMELFQEQTDRIEKELILGFERYPVLQEVGVKTGSTAHSLSPQTVTPVGPVPGKRGYWTACAVMAGFLQGGGVGKTLAEWMIHDEPEADAWPMDVARYGKFMSCSTSKKQPVSFTRAGSSAIRTSSCPRPFKMAPRTTVTEAAVVGASHGISKCPSISRRPKTLSKTSP